MKLPLIAVLLAASTAFAAEKTPPPKAYLTPEEAGPDFQIQGEYEGTLNAAKVGAQVIAMGKGSFRVVVFRGGLPGEPDSRKSPREVEAQKQGDSVTFTNNANTITVGGGKAICKGNGQEFELQRVVRKSPTEGAKAPEGAIALFDGTNVDAWKSAAKMNDAKLLEALSNPTTKQEFKDFTLHVEFLLPFMPDARGQGRANSGVYLQGRYEVQVLDSFGLKGEDNECGGIYRNAAPLVNMCYPPLQWQTYDVDFTAAKFGADGNKTANAVVTIKLNGIVIHDKLELKGPTPGGPKSGGNENSPGPLYLQGHGNPVMYRNIWIVEKGK